MRRGARAAYLPSVAPAREKGPFPVFEAGPFLAAGTMRAMDEDVRAAVAEHGIRNALLTSIAPTGTISLYAGNVSSGIEPVFAHAYTRKVLQKDGSRTEEEVMDYAVQLWRDRHGDAPLPGHFVTAQDLPPEDHVRMQAAAQRWVDSSISKTINVPAGIGFEAFKDVYMQAWDTGCKGCTTYRPNEVTGSVLSVAAEPEPTAETLPTLSTLGARIDWAMATAGIATQVQLAEKSGVAGTTISMAQSGKRDLGRDAARALASALGVDPGWLLFGETPGEDEAPAPPLSPAPPHLGENTPGESPQAMGAAPPRRPAPPAAPGARSGTDAEVVYLSEPLDRPQALEGQTYKLSWPDSEHALYITLNDIIVAGHRRPFEIFINSKNMEHYAWTVALTRMISAVFRRGGDVSFVVEELKAVFDPRGGAWMAGKYVPSILAAIGGVIERHLVAIGFIEAEGLGLKSDPRAELGGGGAPGARRGPSCSACGSRDMRMIEGCMTCASCGFSKCS